MLEFSEYFYTSNVVCYEQKYLDRVTDIWLVYNLRYLHSVQVIKQKLCEELVLYK